MTPQQLNKKQAAPAMDTEAEAEKRTALLEQSDCTPSPEEITNKYKAFVESLPAEMRPKIEQEYQKIMRQALSAKPEKIRGKILTKRMMMQLLARRAYGDKVEVDIDLFDEPYKRYWQAMENAMPGKEIDALNSATGSEDETKRIIESRNHFKNYPALSELQGHIKDITWFWDYRIPNGKMTVLGGEGGVSKSMLAQRICYMQIHETKFPDGTPVHNPGAPVLYVDCEGFASGVKKRAQAWGMDISKFYLWSVDLEKDGFINLSNAAFQDELIERINAMEQIAGKPALVVIDSLGNASAGGQDKVEDVRDLLNFFNQIAYGFDIAVILVAHTRKPPAMFTGKGEITQDDIRGSGHVINMARAAIGVWKVQTDEKPNPNAPRVMAVLKTNYDITPAPLGYEVLRDENGNPKMFFGDAPKPYKEPTKVQKCADWIIATLEEAGEPMQPKELETMAEQEGYKRGNFYDARKLLEKDGRIVDTHGKKIPENKWALKPYPK